MVGSLTQPPPSDYLSPQRSISYPEFRPRQPESSASANENEEFTVHHHGDKQSPLTEQQVARDHSRQQITPVGDNVDVGKKVGTPDASGTQGMSKEGTAVENTIRHHDETDASRAVQGTVVDPPPNDLPRRPTGTPKTERQASRSTTRRRESTPKADTQRHEDGLAAQAVRRSTRQRRQNVKFDENSTIITPNGRESPKQRTLSPIRDNVPFRPAQSERTDALEGEDYVVDRIVSHHYDEAGHLVFRVGWYGYSVEEDTEEPIYHLRRSYILRYCKRRRLKVPSSISRAREG